MAAVAHEPFVPVPSTGAQEDGGMEFASRDSGARTPPGLLGDATSLIRKSFLHILKANFVGKPHDLALAECQAPVKLSYLRLELQDRASVSGLLLDCESDSSGKRCVSEVSFEGTSYAVPSERNLQVPGNFGTLKVSSGGAFSYTRAEIAREFADGFICTVRSDNITSPEKVVLEFVRADSAQFG